MKPKSIFVCQKCGAQSARWVGRCHSCGAWGSFVEEAIAVPSHQNATTTAVQKTELTTLGDVSTNEELRLKTGIAELDRVLGGGIMPGSLVLVGGDPGIGKSTLMLQMCSGLKLYNPLFISGEESLQQLKYRSDRISDVPENLLLLAETNIEQINSAIQLKGGGVAIVDSIQSVTSSNVEATAGSIIQVRECASLLMQTAKQSGKAIFIVGHVTKEGIIAGPKVLEHMVDTVLQFEGEKNYSYRILRARKNRFGSTNEIGLFEMGDKGLIEVTNPSELFLVNRKEQDSGVCIVAAIEGTRPILLEVQALVTPTSYSVPQRTSTGFDIRRLQMIIAVLEKRLGLQFRNYDVFINIAGGLYLNDPSVDLGIASALVSSLKDEPVESKTVLIGEIGLTGEIRAVSAIEQRVREADKLGFKKVILPQMNMKKLHFKSQLELIPVERISLALADLFGS